VHHDNRLEIEMLKQRKDFLLGATMNKPSNAEASALEISHDVSEPT
jgi:hypothetical protein